MYNRYKYNRAAYNRPTEKTVWLELEPMVAAANLENTLSRVLYAEPDSPMRARAILREPPLSNFIYLTPEPMAAVADMEDHDATKYVNLKPGQIVSSARVEDIGAVLSMFPDLDQFVSKAEFEQIETIVKHNIIEDMRLTARAALDVDIALTIGSIGARMTGAAFMEVLEEDIFMKQVAEVTVDIPPGEILVIDRETLTATLDGENVLEQYFGAFFMVLPETISYVIEYDGDAAAQAQIEYTELWY